MLALIRDSEIIALGQSENELAPEFEFFGGKIVPVIEPDIPQDHVVDGAFEYLVEDDKVRKTCKTKYAFSDYIEARKAAYPPIADYLDAVVKGDQGQIQAYIDACLAAKAKYPKPA